MCVFLARSVGRFENKHAKGSSKIFVLQEVMRASASFQKKSEKRHWNDCFEMLHKILKNLHMDKLKIDLFNAAELSVDAASDDACNETSQLIC